MRSEAGTGESGSRGPVADRATALRPHAEDYAVEINRHDPAPPLRATRNAAEPVIILGVVDENVDSTEADSNCCWGLVPVGLAGDVEPVPQRLTAGPPDLVDERYPPLVEYIDGAIKWS
jgi:hypothetical protein